MHNLFAILAEFSLTRLQSVRRLFFYHSAFVSCITCSLKYAAFRLLFLSNSSLNGDRNLSANT